MLNLRVPRPAGIDRRTIPRRAHAALAGSLALAALLALGCAEAVRTQTHPALYELERPIRSIAVVPFRPTGSLPKQRDATVGPAPSVATALVSRHVGEALAKRGVSIVAAEDSARALSLEGGVSERLIPRAVARQMHDEFGVDAVVLGEVWRYQERSGQAAGTRQPASIGFEVVLFEAPSGRKLWSGVFDETQRALSENVLNAGRYPGGGTRWLTADELLRWGAAETAAIVPLGR